MSPAPLVLFPSRWEKRWLYLSHSGAALACLFSPWLWAITLVVAFSLFCSLKRRRLLVVSLQALTDGALRLTLADGQTLDAQLLPSSRVLGALMVLHLQCDAQRIHLLLWPDSAVAENLRQWRVWLRWQWPKLQAQQVKNE
ncbi:protein YgfX [Iodobacter sp. CM08]|uniref:protein YgfX n=1 Tax=Iodobacter sp. CM08 TaxID=3085902 RepID=UPI002980CBD3|nr:protein YgfX [Iodobacter sp. CM08]MDW5415928.1 protein YgfX [Iodobacter sp. CM08]